MTSSAGATPRPQWSTTSYAILGLLSLRRWTTYELAKQVQRSLSWFWPRAERKLYDEPKRLAVGGLAVATRERTGLRPRTVYSITEEGREALRHWLDEPSAPRSSEFEAMLKVFFADAGSLDQLVATLAGIEHEARARLEVLVAMKEQVLAGQTQFPERLHLGALTLPMQFAQEHALLQWSQWAREQLPAWQSTQNPGEWDYQAVLRGLLPLSGGATEGCCRHGAHRDHEPEPPRGDGASAAEAQQRVSSRPGRSTG